MSTVTIIAPDWLPVATMARIIVHWTAGTSKASALDRQHYHILIEGDGKLVRGGPSIALNGLPKARPGYAEHTLGCNSGSIGVSLCGMGGAIEAPFKAGQWPITPAQWDTLPKVLAQLCAQYGIAVSRETVLSHAEVQSTLGITQRGKWDISRLPWAPEIVGSHKVGDLFRAATQKLLGAK